MRIINGQMQVLVRHPIPYAPTLLKQICYNQMVHPKKKVDVGTNYRVHTIASVYLNMWYSASSR